MTKKSQGPSDPFFKVLRQVAEARRLLEKHAAFEVRMAAAGRRAEERRAGHERRLAELAARLAERSGGKPPRPKRFRGGGPPREEGGEPVPATPRPKPKPLAGGAAAPLDPDRRRPAAGTQKGAGRGRVPSDAESRQSL